MQQIETVAKEGVHTECSTVQIMENVPFFMLCCTATRPVWAGRNNAHAQMIHETDVSGLLCQILAEHDPASLALAWDNNKQVHLSVTRSEKIGKG